jgi:hypothetical protein
MQFILYHRKTTSLNMQTRSETRYEASALFKVEIDFDEASRAWRANKKPTGNGCFKYICSARTKTGKDCCRDSVAGSEYCKMHGKQ